MSSLDNENETSIIERTVDIGNDERALGDLSVDEFDTVLRNGMDIYMDGFLKRYKPVITYEESWNRGIEEILRRRGEQAYGYSWMHHECIGYFQLRHNILWISGIVFGTLFTGGGLATVGFNVSKFISMATIIGTVSSPAIAYATGQAQYEKRSEEHRDLEGKYKNLRDLIEEELKKAPVDRCDAEKFMEGTRKEMNELMDPENSPNIPKSVAKAYKKFIKSNNYDYTMSLPVIAGGSGHISLRKKDIRATVVPKEV